MSYAYKCMEGIIMGKIKRTIIKIFTIAMMSLALFSCSNQQEKNISINKSELSVLSDFQEVKSQKEKLIVEEINIPIPENCNVNSFCVYKDKVYYSIEFGDYLTGQMEIGGKEIAFEEKYNTQIRVFHIGTKEDEILYQYKENECVSVSDIQSNGTEVIWEEYKNGAWNIRLVLEDEVVEEPLVVVSQQNDGEQMENITLTIVEDGFYWYDQNENEENPISLHKYDFNKQEHVVKEKNLALKSPYEHVNIHNEIKSLYTEKENNRTIIQICENQNNVNLETDIEVSSPIANEKLCIWMKGYDYHERQELYCFDREKQTAYCIPTAYTFAYEVLGDMILLNQENEIVCYDIKNMERTTLTEGGKGYGFLFAGIEGNIYAEIFDSNEESEELHIINIKAK